MSQRFYCLSAISQAEAQAFNTWAFRVLLRFRLQQHVCIKLITRSTKITACFQIPLSPYCIMCWVVCGPSLAEGKLNWGYIKIVWLTIAFCIGIVTAGVWWASGTASLPMGPTHISDTVMQGLRDSCHNHAQHQLLRWTGGGKKRKGL